FCRLRVEHCTNGYQQGRPAARALLGGAEPYDYIHTFWSDQYEHVIEYVGFAASWDRVVFSRRPERRQVLRLYPEEWMGRGGGTPPPRGLAGAWRAASWRRTPACGDSLPPNSRRRTSGPPPESGGRRARRPRCGSHRSGDPRDGTPRRPAPPTAHQ